MASKASGATPACPSCHRCSPPSSLELSLRVTRRLEKEIDALASDASGTLDRLAIANEDGDLYRPVLVFGFEKRNGVRHVFRELGYRDGGPRPYRQLDAVFLLRK